MAEYIDRESITKRLERVITQGVPNAMGTHSITAEYSLDVIRNLPAADVVERPRWIPVTEQCPEKSGDYLVFDDCRNLYVNEWHCLLKKWQYDDSRITHWQPLPEPPKEET